MPLLAGRVPAAPDSYYPPGVVLAGSQFAYDLYYLNHQGPRIPITKTIGVDANPTGWNVTATTVSSNTIGATLSGWDTNGRQVSITHDDVVVEDSLIWISGTPRDAVAVSTSGPLDNVIVRYNEIRGRNPDTVGTAATAQHGIREHGTANISNTQYIGNWIHGTRDDCIKARGNVVLIKGNRFAKGGMASGAHFDAIDITNALGFVTIEDNLFDMADDPDAEGSTSCVAFFANPNGGMIQRNVVINAGVVYSFYFSGAPNHTSSGFTFTPNANVTWRNNVVDYTGATAIWPSVRLGLDVGASTGNYLIDGTPVTETLTNTDNVPSAYSFTDLTGQAQSTLVTSNNITIAGLGGGGEQTHVTLPVGTSYSLNNGSSWLTATNNSFILVNGNTLRLRQTTAAAPATAVSIAVNIGGVTDTWSATTA